MYTVHRRRIDCLSASCAAAILGGSSHINGQSSSSAHGGRMPVFCAAYGCNNRRTVDTRSRGITFHKFPKDEILRRRWEVVLRREGFTATETSKLCSEHFKPDEFDRTGQIVRLRDGAIPSVFNFPSHLQRPVATRTTKTSRKAKESLQVDLPQHFLKSESLPNVDHIYALPDSPTHLKARLSEALAKVETLEREKQNARKREWRAKKTVKSLLEYLKKKNLITDELKERLDFYSGGCQAWTQHDDVGHVAEKA